MTSSKQETATGICHCASKSAIVSSCSFPDLIPESCFPFCQTFIGRCLWWRLCGPLR